MLEAVAKRAGVKPTTAKAMAAQDMTPGMIGCDETDNYLLKDKEHVELKMSIGEHPKLIRQSALERLMQDEHRPPSLVAQ